MKQWTCAVVISFQQNSGNKRLFNSGKRQFIVYFLNVFLCIMLLTLDCRFHAVGFVRNSLNYFISPLHYVVDYPAHVARSTHVLLRSKKKLIDENTRLRYQQIQLEAKLQKLLSIRNENTHLKRLLSASPSVSNNEHTEVAEILSVETSSSRNLLVLNKGTRDGVYLGQPVLDAKGVMGQIIDLGVRTSTVLLISDGKSAVPVRINRTGERAILVGSNRFNELSLIHLSKSSVIKIGDLLETSGLGGRYPEGYPVARVVRVELQPGDDFIKVAAKPIAHLNSTRLVLLLWPGCNDVALQKQIQERLAITEYPFR